MINVRLIISSMVLIATCNTPALAEVPACFSDIGEVLPVEGISVTEEPQSEGDYRILRIEAANGAYMLAYFDAASEAMARSRATCLGAQLTLLQTELGDTRKGAQWDSVVFTSDKDYAPPRGAGITSRWLIRSDGNADDINDPQKMIIATIPHEQVHEFQRHAGASLPRWFDEGHASWAGLRVSSLLQLSVAKADREERLAQLSTAQGAINLAQWGSPKIKREAILRQLSEADRKRMLSDPNFFPAGASFNFTSDDFESDQTNSAARYAASLMVFDGLEKRHGAAKVRAWALELILMEGQITNEIIAATVKQHFGEDLDTLLADPEPEPEPS